MKPFLQHITVKNVFSFDDEGIDLELQPLNVLIGANASGKSNFLNVLKLLCSTRFNFNSEILQMGGIDEVLWKGSNASSGYIYVCTNIENYGKPIKYELKWNSSFGALQIEKEIIYQDPRTSDESPYLYFERTGTEVTINVATGDDGRKLQRISLSSDEFELSKSVLEQRNDPRLYPELTQIRAALHYCSISGFQFDSNLESLRNANKAGEYSYSLLSSGNNFSLVVNSLDRRGLLKSEILPRLRSLYSHVDDLRTIIEGDHVTQFMVEKNLLKPIPLKRMSDGTLRFLRLLIMLFHPGSPPFICIDEPDIGLHPEVIPTLAEYLIEASEKRQIFITTHSPDLIDCLSGNPESVLVCEREDRGTQITRLDAQKLKNWLEEYRLGALWKKGVIGGTRY